jgi:hypothetical protein
MRRSRTARLAGIAALPLWPVSYAWIPLAERSPGWVFALVPLVEIGALILGVAAVWIGTQARRRDGDSPDARWGIGLGTLALLLIVVGNVVGAVMLT